MTAEPRLVAPSKDKGLIASLSTTGTHDVGAGSLAIGYNCSLEQR